jgi:SPP1 gp7 family putative phage head morphogenesis protein
MVPMVNKAQPRSSVLTNVIDSYYDDLDILDSVARQRLAKAYAESVEVLIPKFEAAILREDANPLNRAAAFQADRYGSLLAQADKEWARYADGAVKQITADQRVALDMGNALSSDMLSTAYRAGPTILHAGFDYLPRSAVTEIVGNLTDGSPLRGLVQEVAGSFAQEMQRLLVTGASTGVNPLATARAMNLAFGAERTRLNTIARTETLRAFREGSRRNMENNANVVSGWQWYSRRDRRTCAMCFALHGTRFELRVRMATHPNCRCTMLPVTKTWAELGYANITDVKNPAFTTPSEALLRGDPVLCRAALGRGGCLGFTNNKILLPEFTQDTYSPRWGYGRTQKPLKTIVGPENARALSAGRIPSGLPTKTPLTNVAPPVPVPQVRQPPLLAKPSVAPAGDTVGSKMLYKDGPKSKYGGDVRDAISAIEEVHGDGGMLPVPVESRVSKKAFGWYSRTGDGKPVEIMIEKAGPARQYTMFHEVGHYIDNQALSTKLSSGGMGSVDNFSPEMVAYRQAMASTRLVKRGKEVLAAPSREYILDSGAAEAVDRRYLSYLLNPKEQWARAYAQYVAKRSGNVELLEQARDKFRPGSVYRQAWDDDDFIAVEKTITDVLRSVGWEVFEP